MKYDYLGNSKVTTRSHLIARYIKQVFSLLTNNEFKRHNQQSNQTKHYYNTTIQIEHGVLMLNNSN